MPNASKRLLIACVIDISPSTAIAGEFGSRTANELINKHLKIFIDQLLENTKIKAAAEICFVTYSTKITSYGFKPLKEYENNVPRFDAVREGGTFTASAVEVAYNAIRARAHNIMSLSSGAGLYTSAMFLLTDGSEELHDKKEVIDRVVSMVNERTVAQSREEQVLPFVVGLGNNLGKDTEVFLQKLSEGFLNGFIHLPGGKDGDVDRDYTRLFSFFSQSLVRMSVRRDEPYVTTPTGARDDAVDRTGPARPAPNNNMAAQLRALVQTEYPDMIRTAGTD